MTVRFVFALCVAGVAAGLVGIGLTELLHLVQHLSFGYTENTFLYGVEHASAARRVLVLLGCGVVAGLGWTVVRRSPVRSVTQAVADGEPLPVGTTTADGILQVVVVGLGASLGREGAPRQIAGALAAAVARRLGLDAASSRIVLAAGAGAGLAAVYDVPVAGVVFSLEAVLRTRALRPAVASVVTCGVATAVSWLVLPDAAVYPVPALQDTPPGAALGALVAFAVVLGVLSVGTGRLFDTVMARARRHAAAGGRLIPTAIVGTTAVGILAVAYPQVLGNGKGPVDLALDGSVATSTAAVLLVLKPLTTALCLRSGLAGGLLTPSLAAGALVGCVLGAGWVQVWPAGESTGACALLGAAAMLAVTQRAPVTAAVLAVELTRCAPALIVPVAVAVGVAAVLSAQVRRRASDHPAERSRSRKAACS